MSQYDFPSSPADSYVGIESTLGTNPGGLTPMFPDTDSFNVSGLAQDEIPVMDERAGPFDHLAPVLGLRSTKSSIDFKFTLRPDGTQLTHSAVPVAHWIGQILQGSLGNVLNSSYSATAGGTVAGSGSTTSSIALSVGHGANFQAGTWAAVQTSIGMEPFFIQTVSGDTITPWPNLANVPTAGGVCANSYTYAPAGTHSASMSFQHAKALDSGGAAQWTILGCIAESLDFAFAPGQLCTVSAKMKAATWVGPSSQGIGIGVHTDTMISPIVNTNGFTWVQPYATTTRTNYPLQTAACKLDLGNDYVREFNGTQGVTSAFRTPKKPFGTVDLNFRFDPTRDSTDWTNSNLLSIAWLFPFGSGATQRWVGVHIPSAAPVNKPPVKWQGGRGVMDMHFEARQDQNISSPSNDLQRAPWRVFLI